MNILMVSAEMAPFAKVGGLADVAGALSAALATRGHDVRAVVPLYGHLDRKREGIVPLKKLPGLTLRVGQQMHDFQYHVRGSSRGRLKIYLVECETLFEEGGIYPASKEIALARASLHAQAALMLPRLLDWPVDVVHAHDAQSALAPVLHRQWYSPQKGTGRAGSLLTIHNLAHQEIHPPETAEVLGLPRSMSVYPGLMEFNGRLNIFKGGLLAADLVNTVSSSYALETTTDPELGCGLMEILAGRKKDYSGIINGADYETWDPAKDVHLPAVFSPQKMKGKEKCRSGLARELGLKPEKEKPLCGYVGRMVDQKGLDLLLPLLDRLAGDGYTFALLGSGDPALQARFRKAAEAHPDQVAYREDFNEPLAHRIYAGCDMFLMPSRYEPCGLSQMYAMKYGSPPVVRRTGGLADTVTDIDGKNGVGFVFDEARPEALLAGLRRAESEFSLPKKWDVLRKRGMALDFSWERSAAEYEKLYKKIAPKAGKR